MLFPLRSEMIALEWCVEPHHRDLGMTPTNIDVLEKKTVFHGYFRVNAYTLRHGRFGGGWTKAMTREVFERGHAAALLPYDPISGDFVICEQFRVGALAAGVEPWQLETVAGIIEDGESPESVARRETVEEAGLTVHDLWPIQHYLVSPGGTSETVSLYLGRVDAKNAGGIFGLPDENENIRVRKMPEAELRSLLDTSRLTNATIVIAAQWFFLNRDKVRAAWTGKP